jgi:hypothetical protein
MVRGDVRYRFVIDLKSLQARARGAARLRRASRRSMGAIVRLFCRSGLD